MSDKNIDLFLIFIFFLDVPVYAGNIILEILYFKLKFFILK